MMVEYLYVFQIWIILGIILIVLEMFDTSTLFFLPLGLAGLVMSGWLYLTEIEVISMSLMPNKWFWLVFVWVMLGLCFTILLTMLRKFGLFGKKEDHDVNQY